MGDNLKQKLTKLIKLADNITNTADEPIPLKQKCVELKSKTNKLSTLLRQAATVSSELYLQRPMRPIIEQTEHVLNKTLLLVLRCHPKNIHKLLTIIPAGIF
ncbi:armadillo/beta-catenin repeat family protein, partial [Trifolium medium]|nr:armadillo/beta-catenin repeat family protein [Trifolium medium]